MDWLTGQGLTSSCSYPRLTVVRQLSPSDMAPGSQRGPAGHVHDAEHGQVSVPGLLSHGQSLAMYSCFVFRLACSEGREKEKMWVMQFTGVLIKKISEYVGRVQSNKNAEESAFLFTSLLWVCPSFSSAPSDKVEKIEGRHKGKMKAQRM